jgi:hypothetical protein
MTVWDEYGPAEFDKRRMPKGRKPQPATQAGLFVMAAEPLPAKPAPQPEELPGQGGLFDPGEPTDCSGVIGAGGLVYSDADPGL